MAFYIAKGLQLAGLVGMPVALYIGLTEGDGLMRELGYAALAALTFYVGRIIESR